MARREPAGRRARGGQTTVRIIGGQWRGRRLPIVVAHDLRPTPDRIRETLFNWLAPRMEGARCLDLFAGTGALGLEALSRGASHVTFVDTDHKAIESLRGTLETLAAADRATLSRADGLQTPPMTPPPDIVFIDPPFAGQLHAGALDAILGALAPTARIYLEYPGAEQATVDALLAGHARVLRRKRAGQVGYCLAQPARDGEDAFNH